MINKIFNIKLDYYYYYLTLSCIFYNIEVNQTTHKAETTVQRHFEKEGLMELKPSLFK